MSKKHPTPNTQHPIASTAPQASRQASASNGGTGARLTEDDLLLAVATCQGILVQAARQILGRDKQDGIAAVRILAEHDAWYRKLADELMRRGVVTEATIEQARRLACDDEGAKG